MKTFKKKKMTWKKKEEEVDLVNIRTIKRTTTKTTTTTTKTSILNMLIKTSEIIKDRNKR